jgi:hypothetical protein
MKKRVFYAVVLILMAVSFTACEELLEDCKMCELVKLINGVEDPILYPRGEPIEYCGAKLLAIEATAPKTIGTNLVAKWECQ